jgi:tetratricopeptide (TPR) repeat protein
MRRSATRRAFGFAVTAAILAPLASGSRAADSPAASAAAEPSSAPRFASRGARDLEFAYRVAFHDFAANDRAKAIARVAAFERETFAASKRGLDLLRQAERRQLVEIGKRRPAALFELYVFYQDLALQHGRDGELALHARAHRTLREILDTLADLSRGGDRAPLVARAYQGWAVDLISGNSAKRAGEALVASLAIAPDDAPANLTLAILLQREGRGDEALEWFDRALTLDPDLREARLRAAILRARDPENAAAGAELEALAGGAERDWIAALAAEERARQLFAARRYENGVAWIESMVARFPAEPGLQVALAWGRRQLGRRATAADAARAALAATSPGPFPEPTARRRYGESPARLIVARRFESRDEIDRGWGQLAAALGPLVTVGDTRPVEVLR